jgi:ATP-dependent DNA helicase RecQ
LTLLRDLGIVKPVRGQGICLLNDRLSSGNLAAVANAYRERQATDRDKLEQMMGYGQSAKCRWMLLLEYFGESLEEPCGTCDNCRHPPEAEIAQPARRGAA